VEARESTQEMALHIIFGTLNFALTDDASIVHGDSSFRVRVPSGQDADLMSVADKGS
jgi:hypothetical protein